MRKIISALLFISFSSWAQTDSTLHLNEVIVKAYESSKTLLFTPAALQSISGNELRNQNPLLTFNAQPGIRMEERSPGSYRLAIRGSVLRSPYGIRNVKMYWNGIPYSDANGGAYFNLIDFNSLGNVEIIKGLASNIFGGGYGGVVNMNTKKLLEGTAFSAKAEVGSFNTLTQSYSFEHADDRWNIHLTQSAYSSDGYRDHTQSNALRNALKVEYKIHPKQTIGFSQMYAQMDYKTPGGLTLAQMEANRKASRPGTATQKSTKEQNTSIRQNFYLAGINHIYQFSNQALLNTSLFFNTTDVTNPALATFENREESTWGYRSVYQQQIHHLNLTAGMEGIFTNSTSDVYENLSGVQGNFEYLSKIKSQQLSHFIAAEYTLPAQIQLTAGLSYNIQQYHNHTIDKANSSLNMKQNPAHPWSPRISILKNWKNKTSIYYTYSKGFSSPTAQEIAATYENSPKDILTADYGFGHEVGIKKIWNSLFESTVSVYQQTIKEAITRQVNDLGEEYFINTGRVNQKGIEWGNKIAWASPNQFISNTQILVNGTYNDYRFEDYLTEGNNWKGNQIPGVSKWNFYFNAKLIQKQGFYGSFNLNYLSKMFLNSANTATEDGILLSQVKLGWSNTLFSKFQFDVYTTVDNLLNQKYSLGLDFNAFGNRYYNPSPLRNYLFGARISMPF